MCTDNYILHVLTTSLLSYVEMNQLIKRSEEVKTSLEKARRTEGFQFIKTEKEELTAKHIYDVDMMRIRGICVRDLEYLCTGFVDICGPVPYKQRNLGLGKCVVSAPVMLFIDNADTEIFVEALRASCADRILCVDFNNPNRFLTSGPKKVHMHHIIETLLWARIPHVNAYVFAMKSNWNSLAWLDKVNEHNPNATIYLDIGWYLPVGQGDGDIVLIKPKEGHRFVGGQVYTYPMLSSC